MIANSLQLHAEKIDTAITMLNTYLDENTVKPIIPILKAIKADASDESLLDSLADTLNGMGVAQGAVLTYAPYVAILLSDKPFGDE